MCDIPETIDGSFYRGQVFVALKDATLEPSSPLRHSTELSKLLRDRNITSPVLLIYTDGGPDHNTTFLSVQLGLIALFLHHDLDMVEAVRTAPYHSWKNPCERVNCILNLGLQAIGLMRSKMEDRFEKVISSCNSIQDVRRAVGETPGLQEALQDSTEPTKALMHSIFSRLSLKDKPVLSYSTASDHEMDALFSVLHSIESALTRNHSKKDLHKLPRLKEFFAHCCYQRKYVFGVKKCGKLGCAICRPPQLQETIFQELCHIPDPVEDDDQQHYKPFSSVYGTLTTEKDRPSTKCEGKKSHGLPFSPSSQTARSLIVCSECLRPRVLYSQRKLSIVETNALTRTVEGFLYTCGATLCGLEVVQCPDDPPTISTLFQRVFVKGNLTCENPVEVPYYSCEAFEMVCVHCAHPHESAQEGQYP